MKKSLAITLGHPHGRRRVRGHRRQRHRHRPRGQAGYVPVPVELTGLKKGGGSVKCCIAELRP
jgi:N-dimethylarginine dimethylaminohydrolase